mmetsp:Transcript_40791/g.95307  ORF Transcript_40791/g.95307 Transcript_40791/m.95307 type:complete len:207 (+) Transcript_40791:537-1157(+)
MAAFCWQDTSSCLCSSTISTSGRRGSSGVASGSDRTTPGSAESSCFCAALRGVRGSCFWALFSTPNLKVILLDEAAECGVMLPRPFESLRPLPTTFCLSSTMVVLIRPVGVFTKAARPVEALRSRFPALTQDFQSPKMRRRSESSEFIILSISGCDSCEALKAFSASRTTLSRCRIRWKISAASASCQGSSSGLSSSTALLSFCRQ